MTEIHVQIAEGKESVYTEEQVTELLRQGALPPDSYYWREGMTHWRRLSKFRPLTQAVVPERRTDVLPDPADRPQPVERSLPLPTDRATRSSRRFRLRRRPEFLTYVVQIFLVALLLVTLAELALALRGLPAAGGEAAPAHLGPVLGWIGLGLNFVFLIPYGMWVYRAALNSRSLSSITTFTPKWAVGCYFVPVMNLIRPYQAMQEVWRVSGNPRGWQGDPPSALVTLWWTFWLLTLGLAEASFLMNDEALTAQDVQNAGYVFLGLKVVQAVWYALFLVMITRIVRRQVDLTNSTGGLKTTRPDEGI